MTIAAGATAFGVLAKAAENSFLRIRVNNATDGNIGIAVFNLATVALVSGSGTIKQLLNGWCWCYVTCTTTITNSAVFFDLTPDGTTFSYNGTTGNGVYLTRASCYLSAAIGAAVQTTATTVAVTVPLVDVDDPLAYLVEEQAPDTSMLELSIARFNRAYANVPTTTTVPKSIMVNRPTIPSSYSSYTSLVVDGVSGAITGSTSFRFAEAYYIDARAGVYQDVYPMITVSGAAIVIATGGTFTFTYKTSTTAALNATDSGATIQTAINLLADIIADGITATATNNLMSAGNGYLQVSSNITWPQSPSVNYGSLTPALATTKDSALTSATIFIAALRIKLPATSHGLTNTGQNLAGGLTTAATSYIISSSNWSVGDANTILVKSTVITANNFTTTTTNWMGAFVKRYTPNSSAVQVNAVTRYSLSAITPDTYQGDPYNFLVQLFAGNTAINYQVGDSAKWPSAMSPINSLTTIQVSAAVL